jgi:pyruvate ferredoxin oxidoreductase alpha subunit
MAYKIAEDERVRLPVAFGYDGYVLSYTAEPVEIPRQEDVDDWLPPYKAIPSILPDEVGPATFARGFGEDDPQMRWKTHHDAILNTKDIITEVNESFGKKFGRSYGNGLIEEYRTEDAEAVIVAMGSLAGTARAAVDRHQDDGNRVGLVKLKCFVPFPTEDIQELATKVDAIGMIDRNVCLGHGGAAYTRIRNAIYDMEDRPSVLEFFAGMGGKEVRVDDIYKVGVKTLKAAKGGKVSTAEVWV